MTGTAKVILWLVIAIVVIVAIWLGVVQQSSEQQTIKIGFIGPLTGGAAEYGQSAKKGIDLAVSAINQAGGINGANIEVIYEDSKADPKEGVTAIQKLLMLGDVPAIIGAMASSVTLAVAPIAEQNKVVLLSPASSAPTITEAGDYIFRNELSEALGAERSAEFYFELGFTDIAILYINNDYGISVKDVTEDVYGAKDGNIVAKEIYNANETDFRTQLSKIKATNPQAILVVGYMEMIQILEQIEELGIEVQVLSTPNIEEPKILENVGNLAEGIIYTYYGGFNLKSEKDGIKDFIIAFQERYSEKPAYFAALAYDAVNILKSAIERGGVSSDGIKGALYDTKNYAGVTGLTTFDENGDVEKPTILKTIKNGQFVLYEEE